jgi:ubiquinone/menaquinone biosynthesis C-methylase UbiE
VAPAADAAGILAPRTLANSHPGLLRRLAPGLAVLDVGSGPGALTAEIARRVHPGRVVGLDASAAMVRLARDAYPRTRLPNLTFRRGDILAGGWDGAFDLVTATRTLSWIADPGRALREMGRAAAPGGRVVALDVDHARAAWRRPPRAWTRFVDAFLAGRRAAGLDNALATRLPALLRAAGLVGVTAEPRVVRVRAGEPDFFRVAGAWRMLAEGRGRQMVAAGFLDEAARRAAEAAFAAWMLEPGAIQAAFEVCAEGRARPRVGPPAAAGAPVNPRRPRSPAARRRLP